MSFADTLTLKNQAGTDQDFVRTNVSGQTTIRTNKTSGSPSEPQEMRISHSLEGKGAARAARHLVQFNTTNVDGLVSGTGTVNLTIRQPINEEVSQTDIENMLRELVHFITGSATPTVSATVVGQLLRGES